MSNWKTQARDAQGRFLSKVEVAVPTPVVKKRVSKKAKETVIPQQFNVFLIDDSTSIRHNGMVDSIRFGFSEIVSSIEEVANDGKINMSWGISFFGEPGSSNYLLTKKAPNLDNYKPRQGSTALYDGIVNIINNTKIYLKSVENANVVLNIFTDGYENSSRKNSLISTNKAIKEAKNAGWMINFIGGGSEKFVKQTAQDLGIFAANTVSYQTNSEDTKAVLSKVSAGMSSYSRSVKKGEATNDGFFM